MSPNFPFLYIKRGAANEAGPRGLQCVRTTRARLMSQHRRLCNGDARCERMDPIEDEPSVLEHGSIGRVMWYIAAFCSILRQLRANFPNVRLRVIYTRP
jgi:hypothetical protein